MDGSMPLYIYVPITFLTWRGLVHAIVGMDASTPSKKSFEHKYTMAWTRPRQVKKVIGT